MGARFATVAPFIWDKMESLSGNLKARSGAKRLFNGLTSANPGKTIPV
jgi:hypothetical protein